MRENTTGPITKVVVTGGGKGVTGQAGTWMLGRLADRLVPAHAPSIERIVENLVSNAIKHTGDDISITVGVAAAADGAVVTVADEGPGIPPEVADTIFKPFVQGPDSSAHHSPGTGVGLTLVEGLVALHGGTIRYESNEPSGSRFVVRLPATTPEHVPSKGGQHRDPATTDENASADASPSP